MTTKENLMTLALVIPGAIVMAVGLSALLAWPVMLLWNDVIPGIFGLCKLTFLQAWGLNVLTSLLFKTTVTK